jgi:TolB-like protein
VTQGREQDDAPPPAAPGSRLGALLAEFRRRRVFRVMVGYGIFSFAVLQVIEPVLHAFHLPDLALTAVVSLLGVGFPLAMLLSWAYDLTAQGVRRTPAATGPGALVISRGRLVALLLGVGLLAALPGAGWYAWNRSRQPATGEAGAGPPSVAVLPFVNMSGDPENEYFSDGLSEEILNALAQIPGLRVPARTSAFAFKGKQENVRRIAEALQVANVLEGSVRKAGGRVRITAQLVKASDGYHLWSQVFERELKDVFAVQDEIAAAIAGALKLQLAAAPAGAAGAGGSTRKAGPSTTNTEAYEAYLQGRHELNERTRPSIEKSIVHLQRAVALDPKFAVAWADLSLATVFLARGNYGEAPVWQAVARARPFLERAQALAPDHPEVLAVAGQIALNAIQSERALEYLDRSLALNPNNAEALTWRRGALENLGRYDQILAAAAAAVRADPLSRLALNNYIEELFRFRRDADLGPALDRLKSLDEPWWRMALGGLAGSRGDRVEAVRNLLPSLQQGRTLAGAGLAASLAELGLRQEALRAGGDPYNIAMLCGDYRGAEALALSAARRSPDDPYYRLDLAFVYYATGRFKEASDLAEQNVRELGFDDLDPATLVVLAQVSRQAGRPVEAARYRDQATLLTQRSAGAGVNPIILDFIRGRLAAYDGRDDEAVALLHRALTSTGFSWGRADLAMPLFTRLLRRPDYQAALKGLDAILAAQRAQVVKLLCGPQRISATWQPAPETCAGYSPR